MSRIQQFIVAVASSAFVAAFGQTNGEFLQMLRAMTHESQIVNGTAVNLQSHSELDTNAFLHAFTNISPSEVQMGAIANGWMAYFPLTFETNDTEVLKIDLATNVVTDWITVEDHRPKQHPATLDDLTNATFIVPAVMTYDPVKQVGFLVTNRVLRVIHDGVTNDVPFATLYRDEWPTQKRTLSIPR